MTLALVGLVPEGTELSLAPLCSQRLYIIEEQVFELRLKYSHEDKQKKELGERRPCDTSLAMGRS